MEFMVVMLIVSQSLTKAMENTGQTYNDIGQLFEKQVSVLVCVFVYVSICTIISCLIESF